MFVASLIIDRRELFPNPVCNQLLICTSFYVICHSVNTGNGIQFRRKTNTLWLAEESAPRSYFDREQHTFLTAANFSARGKIVSRVIFGIVNFVRTAIIMSIRPTSDEKDYDLPEDLLRLLYSPLHLVAQHKLPPELRSAHP